LLSWSAKVLKKGHTAQRAPVVLAFFVFHLQEGNLLSTPKKSIQQTAKEVAYGEKSYKSVQNLSISTLIMSDLYRFC
jgi:hypothetical protein